MRREEGQEAQEEGGRLEAVFLTFFFLLVGCRTVVSSGQVTMQSIYTLLTRFCAFPQLGHLGRRCMPVGEDCKGNDLQQATENCDDDTLHRSTFSMLQQQKKQKNLRRTFRR